MARTTVIIAIFILSIAPGVATAAGDRENGRDIAHRHCARCHVIGDHNRMGGIGSTPSFPLLRRMADWRERFGTFYNRRPHPVHVRVEGVRQWTNLPPNAEPFTITQDNVDDILAFVEKIDDGG
jgi:mono/diheme cytochrome c family protein